MSRCGPGSECCDWEEAVTYLTGLKSKFFKQNLWFRESDGVFLRAQPRNGAYAEFVGEQRASGPAAP